MGGGTGSDDALSGIDRVILREGFHSCPVEDLKEYTDSYYGNRSRVRTFLENYVIRAPALVRAAQRAYNTRTRGSPLLN